MELRAVPHKMNRRYVTLFVIRLSNEPTGIVHDYSQQEKSNTSREEQHAPSPEGDRGASDRDGEHAGEGDVPNITADIR